MDRIVIHPFCKKLPTKKPLSNRTLVNRGFFKIPNKAESECRI